MTAYDMRMRDWSSSVCSSVLFFRLCAGPHLPGRRALAYEVQGGMPRPELLRGLLPAPRHRPADLRAARRDPPAIRRRMRNPDFQDAEGRNRRLIRSEEHTSELQSLMRISYAVFCLKKKKTKRKNTKTTTNI